jgi:uncharacterized protein
MARKTVRIRNATKGTVVAERAGVADTFWSSFVGLMGKPALPRGEALLITPSSSIHTHFMRFPIDVLYVNKEDEIVGIDRAIKPWRFGRFYKKVRYVIETTGGGTEGCEVGDQLRIEGP